MTTDVVQLASLWLFATCLMLAYRQRLHSGYWLAFFMVIAHHTVFYAVVVLQNFGILGGLPTMAWGVAVRLHFGIVLLGYLIDGKK